MFYPHALSGFLGHVQTLRIPDFFYPGLLGCRVSCAVVVAERYFSIRSLLFAFISQHDRRSDGKAWGRGRRQRHYYLRTEFGLKAETVGARSGIALRRGCSLGVLVCP